MAEQQGGRAEVPELDESLKVSCEVDALRNDFTEALLPSLGQETASDETAERVR